MTTNPNTQEIAAGLTREFGAGVSSVACYLEVSPALLLKVAEYLKNTPGLDFDFFDMVTAVDFPANFELNYNLISLKNNASLLLKVHCAKDNPAVPSLANLWNGANLQEREIFDLFGIEFSGHPDLKRIVLWDGFEGHPLRKDFKEKTYGAGN